MSPESQNSKPKTIPLSMSHESWNSEPVVALDDRMFGQVYLRREAAVPKLPQVLEFDPSPENEVRVPNYSLEAESELNLLIAIRKESERAPNGHYFHFLCCVT